VPKGEGQNPYAWTLLTKSSCPEPEPRRAQSFSEAEAVQLIELGRPGPATREPPASALPPVPSRRRRTLGAEGQIEGRRCRRLSPGLRRPLPPEKIPLSRRLRVTLGAWDPQLDCSGVINGTAGRGGS
jgi:hypothetical protein